MSPPRPSIFRTALQVSKERIGALNEGDLGELMADLLRAQAHRSGSPLEGLVVNTQEKAKDGGCDGWTAKPSQADPWLGDADTCWQLKAGSAGIASRLGGEVLKPIPRKTLEAGGRFVLVATGSRNGKQGEQDREAALRLDAAAQGIPTDRISVIGSERLAEWCNQNPAVAARWAGRPEGMWTLPNWSEAEVHQVPWQASELVIAELARQRIALEFDSGTVHHLHVQGQPGVGKTRFALELCRDAPWAKFVVYIQQASDSRLQELLDSAASDEGVRLVVVADEVQPEQLLPLRESVARGNGRIRLITIGHCTTPDPARIPALALLPLEDEVANRIVRGWHASMPTEHVDFIVRFADGYVRLLRLAADAVARDGLIDVRGLISRDEIRGFMDRMLGSGDRRALHVVAVLSSVGWTGDKMLEGKAVAEHLGMDWNEVRAKVDDYDRRLGIAPQSGRYRYISPTPLGSHLAVEAWRTYGELLASLPDALPTDGAKEAYYERLQAIASTPGAREHAREQLAFFFRVEDFVDGRGVQRWAALTPADPDQAARNAFRALNGSSHADRMRIGDRARREAVNALARLAWRPGSFADAVKALALLAEAENETWANNATAEFVGRFQVFLGGTAVPYRDRLLVLDELAADGGPSLVGLVVRALSRVGMSQEFQFGSGPLAHELPGTEWYPETGAEHLRSVLSAIERLKTLSHRAIPELSEEFVTAAKELGMLLREAPVRASVMEFFAAVRAAYPTTREDLRRAIADVIYRERKYWNELTEAELDALDAFHRTFEDASLQARLRQYVGTASWDREDQPDLRPLARELLAMPAVLAEEWPWLTSGRASDAWRFGEALAEEDADRTLASSLLDQNSGRDSRVVCGYASKWRQKLGDRWYEDWFASLANERPRSTRLLFELVWRCGATPAIARSITRALREETIASEVVGQIEYGTWGDSLESEPLSELLRALIDTGHHATALGILEHRTKQGPEDLERWRTLALELITRAELIRSGHMTSYHWKELASRFVNDHASEIAAAIVKAQGDRSAETWFVEHSDAKEILHACVTRAPGAVWQALVSELSSRQTAFSFSVGFPRGVVDQVPAADVLGWVGELPEERASIMAQLVTKNFASDETLASRILGAYADNDHVADAFFGNYVSGSWSGPASARWERLGATMQEVAARSALPKLRRWAIDAARRLEEMAALDRQREEEEELRGH